MIFREDVCKAYKIVGKTDIGDEIGLQARGGGGGGRECSLKVFAAGLTRLKFCEFS